MCACVTGVQTCALPILSRPAAAAQLGLIGLLQFLPLFVTTPITGWVADRFDRRWITRVTLCLQVFCALVLAIATHEGVMGLPILFSIAVLLGVGRAFARSEEHTSELQSLMRISYAVFCLT